MSTALRTELGKVGVLFGGRSAERDISLMSGEGVLKSLLEQGIDAHAFDPAKRSLAELAAEKFEKEIISLLNYYNGNISKINKEIFKKKLIYETSKSVKA